jgi:hypothetical protein
MPSNAREVPSGAHDGLVSEKFGVFVICVRFEPSIPIVKRSKGPEFPVVDRAKTIVLPSGDTSGCMFVAPEEALFVRFIELCGFETGRAIRS